MNVCVIANIKNILYTFLSYYFHVSERYVRWISLFFRFLLFAPREVKARLKQAGGKTAELVFKSNGDVLDNDYDIKNGNNPYYQWGRKDPMLPGNGIGDTDKTCYPGSPEYKFKYGSEGLNTTEIKEYIRNPHKFNIKLEMDGQYYNLWSTDNDKTDANDEVVIKSVYDPSPVGYSLPVSNAFTGFTTTGEESRNSSELNVKGYLDKGYYFYTKPNKTGIPHLFAASGSRHYNGGSLYGVTTVGICWVAGPYNRNYGRYLGFGSGNVYPLNYAYRSYGFPVRSAEEKETQPLTIPTRNFPVRHRFQSEVLQCPYPFGYIRSVKSLF